MRVYTRTYAYVFILLHFRMEYFQIQTYVFHEKGLELSPINCSSTYRDKKKKKTCVMKFLFRFTVIVVFEGVN